MIHRGAILGGVLGLLLLGSASAAWFVLAPGPDSEAPEERLPLPPLPPRMAGSDEYAACLDRIPADPTGAASMAETWANGSGGGPALHCLGLARVALGDAADGANLLTRAAEDNATPPAARAAIYGQVAEAWMIADDIPRAFGASSIALSFAPDDPDLLVDHAVAAAALGSYSAALDDLTHALEVDPQRTDALTLRGATFRRTGDIAHAQDDIDRALTLDPDNAEALLERGILCQRRDDEACARRDWERAIAIAPDSPAADLAQQNLALLEAGPSR